MDGVASTCAALDRRQRSLLGVKATPNAAAVGLYTHLLICYSYRNSDGTFHWRTIVPNVLVFAPDFLNC